MVVTRQRSWFERLSARLDARLMQHDDDSESGSMLLDVIIGIAIILLIAYITVSQIGQYRARAYEMSAVSDAQSISTLYESYITDSNGNYAAPTQAATGLVTLGNGDTFQSSNSGDNKMVWNSIPSAANGYTFSFCVIHSNAEYAIYDSSKGGVVTRGRSGAPATAAACTG